MVTCVEQIGYCCINVNEAFFKDENNTQDTHVVTNTWTVNHHPRSQNYQKRSTFKTYRADFKMDGSLTIYYHLLFACIKAKSEHVWFLYPLFVVTGVCVTPIFICVCICMCACMHVHLFANLYNPAYMGLTRYSIVIVVLCGWHWPAKGLSNNLWVIILHIYMFIIVPCPSII